jgi:hypothetical protein
MPASGVPPRGRPRKKACGGIANSNVAGHRGRRKLLLLALGSAGRMRPRSRLHLDYNEHQMDLERAIEFILDQQAKAAGAHLKFEEQLARLAENQANLAEKQANLAETQTNLAETQTNLAETQTNLAGQMAEQQAKLAGQMAEQQARLAGQMADQQAKLSDQQAKSTEGHDRSIAAIQRTLDRAVKLGIQEARTERKRRQEMGRRFDEKITQLAAAQLVTEEKLQNFIASLGRTSNGGPQKH